MSSAGDTILENAEKNIIQEGSILASGKDKLLKLRNDGLIIEDKTDKSKSDKNKDIFLTWKDVICAKRNVKSSSDASSSFTLHFIHKSKKKLRAASLALEDKDKQAEKWVNAINESCHKVSGRPEKAIVVVNPIGGARRGKQIYLKTVAQLLDLAGIQTSVIFTERSKQGLELGEQQDFSGYDVLIVVGGDGLYQEVLQGLTMQAQKKAGVDYNNPDSVFAKPGIPLAIIPAGTGNGLSGWVNGVIDEETAVLNIIRGEQLKTQILTVHSLDKFVSLSHSTFGYGEFSDLIKVSEDNRWMGRARYPYCILGMLVKKPRMFNCHFEYRLADEESVNAISLGATSSQGKGWRVYTNYTGPWSGMFILLAEVVVDGNDVIYNPQGKSVDVFLDFGCSRIDLMKILYKFASGKDIEGPMPAKMDHLSKVTGLRMKLTDNDADMDNISRSRAKERELERILNIDGEVVYVDKPEFDLRLHSEFTSVFGCLKEPTAAKTK